MAVATWGRGVALAEVATGRTGQQFECSGRPLALAFSPDGRLLVAGGADGAVTVWDLAAGRAVRRFAGHRGPVAALSFAPDGHRLASGSADGTALIWDTVGLRAPAPAGPAGRAASWATPCSGRTRRPRTAPPLPWPSSRNWPFGWWPPPRRAPARGRCRAVGR
ncbi:WD40 repeat domain-containing protein [Frigoriglobus tundricola]|uniref:WD40 repeat domain-containing protein n=1 Tax=Frigoriglobus tundricola TaxID=2774151 RepID=UPI001D08A71B|nr:hypothetical protein [Frigoriglobus tundricola]